MCEKHTHTIRRMSRSWKVDVCEKHTHNSTRVDGGRKYFILLALRMKARTVVGKGEEGPPCDPGSEYKTYHQAGDITSLPIQPAMP